MLIVVPVAASDHDMVSDFCQLIQSQGYLGPHHEVHVLSSPEATEDAKALVEAFSPVADRPPTLEVLETNPSGGWPRACNQHFRAAVYSVARRGVTTPWYWFELDNTPLRSGWVTTLEQEYFRAAEPYMGVIHPTFFRKRVDASDPGVFVETGRHMVGTGIYPPDLASRSTLLHYMVDTPFDVELQWEILSQGCHHTELIQHNWGTVRYRKKRGDKEIVCSNKTEGMSPLVHNGPVRRDAVVLHGCKDGSLARLLTRTPDFFNEP